MVLRFALVAGLLGCATPPPPVARPSPRPEVPVATPARDACADVPPRPTHQDTTPNAPLDRIALSLDHESTHLAWVEPGVAASFARVPPFTLYRDGLLVRQRKDGTIVEQRLGAAERDALLARVEALGAGRLVSHLDACVCDAGGTSCLEDGWTTILRARPSVDAELHEVFVYGDGWNDRPAAHAIIELLTTYEAGDAHPYAGVRGTLAIFRLPRDGGPCTAPDAFVKRLLALPKPSLHVWARAVDAADLARARKVFDPQVRFCDGDRAVRGKVIPWLPDADNSAPIAAWQREAIAAPE